MKLQIIGTNNTGKQQFAVLYPQVSYVELINLIKKFHVAHPSATHFDVQIEFLSKRGRCHD